MKVAARFYEKKGFERCERYNDNPQAAIFMRKTIRGHLARLRVRRRA